MARGVRWLVWSPCSEYPASTTKSLTVLRLPLRTPEASGDRHSCSRSTGEPVVQCRVQQLLLGGGLHWYAGEDALHEGCCRVSGWSHCRSSHREAWALPGPCSPEPMAESHKPPLVRGPCYPPGGLWGCGGVGVWGCGGVGVWGCGGVGLWVCWAVGL